MESFSESIIHESVENGGRVGDSIVAIYVELGQLVGDGKERVGILKVYGAAIVQIFDVVVCRRGDKRRDVQECKQEYREVIVCLSQLGQHYQGIDEVSGQGYWMGSKE
jgi:hypothetical protein